MSGCQPGPGLQVWLDTLLGEGTGSMTEMTTPGSQGSGRAACRPESRRQSPGQPATRGSNVSSTSWASTSPVAAAASAPPGCWSVATVRTPGRAAVVRAGPLAAALPPPQLPANDHQAPCKPQTLMGSALAVPGIWGENRQSNLLVIMPLNQMTTVPTKRQKGCWSQRYRLRWEAQWPQQNTAASSSSGEVTP